MTNTVVWSGTPGHRSMNFLPFNCYWYKIAPGDTLSSIAMALIDKQDVMSGMRVLMQLNPFIDEPNKIYEGDFLVIPNKPNVDMARESTKEVRWAMLPWVINLPMQQQVALMLPIRGPDNIRSNHEYHSILMLYRASVLCDAFKGREITSSDETVSFLSMKLMKKDVMWKTAVKQYFETIDELPRHFTSRLRRAACILNYKHPNLPLRNIWTYFYTATCKEANLEPETEAMLDSRLSDNDRKGWVGYV